MLRSYIMIWERDIRDEEAAEGDDEGGADGDEDEDLGHVSKYSRTEPAADRSAATGTGNVAVRVRFRIFVRSACAV